MAEADVLTVCINTLAAGMVSGGVVNVERSSPDPCELSCELGSWRQKCYGKPQNRDHWAREAAQLGLLSAQPAPT